MNICIDIGSVSLKRYNDLFNYCKTNKIEMERYSLRNITKIISNYDVIFTSNDQLIGKLVESDKNIIVNSRGSISIEILEFYKNTPLELKKGKENILKYICKLEKI